MELIPLIAVGFLGRVLPHLPNATPVGALAVFSGSRLGVRRGAMILLTVMLASDALLGLHPVMWATYSAVFIYLVLGNRGVRQVTFSHVTGAAVTGSVLFFILTNFAVWALPVSLYPKTLTGFTECYIAALPFFRNTVLSDLFYSYVFFGCYVLVSSLSAIRRRKREVRFPTRLGF